MPLELCGLSVLAIAKILSVAFLSIVFLQSGIDKVNNWSGNLSWMRDDHFAKTPLKKIVPLLLGVLTLLEITSGVLGGVGIVVFLTGGSGMFMLWGAIFSAISCIAFCRVFSLSPWLEPRDRYVRRCIFILILQRN